MTLRSRLPLHAVIGSLLLCPLQLHSEPHSITDALTLAKINDPAYLSTQSELAAARERYKQSISGVLPQITASAGNTWAHRDYETKGSPFPPEITTYEGRTAQLNINQPIWRRSNLIAMSQSEKVLMQGQMQVDAAEQDLKVRLAVAWFDMMKTNDQIIYTTQRATAAKKQMEQLREATDLQLAAQPKMEEAQARYEQAVAERLAAASEHESKVALIEEIVGATFTPSAYVLSDKCSIPFSSADTLEEWVHRAETQSPNVAASRFAFEAAIAEVNKQRSGHEPTVDLVGTYSRNNQGAGNFPGQDGYDIKQRSIGIQLNIPLYSGGMQHAKVGEAVALKSKAEHDLEAAIRSARSISKVSWHSLQAARSRQQAALQGLKSTTLALQSATAGVTTGLKFELDVLEAEEAFLGAWKDLQTARYDMLLSDVKLRAASGLLADDDFTRIDRSLAACAIPAEAVDSLSTTLQPAP